MVNTVIAESNSVAMVAFYTPGVDFLRNAGIHFVRENGIGSTLQVTGNTGLIQDRYEYDAYGKTYTLQQNQFTPYLFAAKHGYYSDGDSGMNLLGHRYYLPLLGRFLTQDPVGHGAGLNLYTYASNNPLANIDPTGLDWAIGPSGHPWLVFSWEGPSEVSQ